MSSFVFSNIILRVHSILKDKGLATVLDEFIEFCCTEEAERVIHNSRAPLRVLYLLV